MQELLAKLSQTPGISGCESEVRDIIKDEIKESADQVETDSLGNLIATKGQGEPKLLLVAHMDQIGLAVKSIDDKGFVHFSKIGGIDDRSLVNQRVKVHTDQGQEITGVISAKPPHLLEEEDKEKPYKKKEMFIDVGASDEEEAEELGIERGNFIQFDRSFEVMGNDNRVTSLAFDNRVGCLMLIEALKKFDEGYTLHAVFSAQEEVGLKGAKTSAFSLNPDVALALDTNVAGDLPNVEEEESPLKLNEGPVFDFIEAEGRGLIAPETIRDWLKETAKEEEMDYQVSVTEGGRTDAARVYIERAGIPTGVVSIPVRNIHSCVEVLDMRDVRQGLNLLESLFASLPDYFG